jgi:hypothetical protein
MLKLLQVLAAAGPAEMWRMLQHSTSLLQSGSCTVAWILMCTGLTA